AVARQEREAQSVSVDGDLDAQGAVDAIDAVPQIRRVGEHLVGELARERLSRGLVVVWPARLGAALQVARLRLAPGSRRSAPPLAGPARIRLSDHRVPEPPPHTHAR